MHGSTEGGNGFVTGCIDFTSGSLAAIALVYVSQPMDTVKVKMQTFPKLYDNMIDCTVRTFKRDGVARGLYAGTIPALVANVAENSVLFAAYGFCQKFVGQLQHKRVQDLSPLDNATAGFLASFFSSFTLCPTELIKCKLQALRETQTNSSNSNAKIQHISPYQLTKQILKSEGVPGLFRGLTSTFVREMPGYFFFFGGYEVTRQLFTKPGQTKDDIGPLKTMASGAVGGVALWTAIFPADVIKSRIQVQSLKLSMTTVGLDILKNEGISSLYNGLKPTLVRTIPATGVLFVVYEYTKKFLSNLLE
uniref:Putative amino acid transmembrane transport n=1 Tax=Corethrella appendiculata TaxID=1370023 RepID=U5EMU4_9DIPT